MSLHFVCAVDGDKLHKVGPYQLTKVLGKGACATVKLGVHEYTGANVAVKIMSKALLMRSSNSPSTGGLRRVEREVALMRMMDHPHIAKFINVVETDAHIIIVMEYINGGDLYSFLRRHARGGLPAELAFRFFHQLSSALFCHRFDPILRPFWCVFLTL